MGRRWPSRGAWPNCSGRGSSIWQGEPRPSGWSEGLYLTVETPADLNILAACASHRAPRHSTDCVPAPTGENGRVNLRPPANVTLVCAGPTHRRGRLQRAPDSSGRLGGSFAPHARSLQRTWQPGGHRRATSSAVHLVGSLLRCSAGGTRSRSSGSNWKDHFNGTVCGR
jgi:hypothetical protein